MLGAHCVACSQVCPRAPRDKELLSPWHLLEDMAAMAPDVHSNSQHSHSDVPGTQQQLMCSAVASSRAGPWLSPPPAPRSCCPCAHTQGVTWGASPAILQGSPIRMGVPAGPPLPQPLVMAGPTLSITISCSRTLLCSIQHNSLCPRLPWKVRSWRQDMQLASRQSLLGSWEEPHDKAG